MNRCKCCPNLAEHIGAHYDVGQTIKATPAPEFLDQINELAEDAGAEPFTIEDVERYRDTITE